MLTHFGDGGVWLFIDIDGGSQQQSIFAGALDASGLKGISWGTKSAVSNVSDWFSLPHWFPHGAMMLSGISIQTALLIGSFEKMEQLDPFSPLVHHWSFRQGSEELCNAIQQLSSDIISIAWLKIQFPKWQKYIHVQFFFKGGKISSTFHLLFEIKHS